MWCKCSVLQSTCCISEKDEPHVYLLRRSEGVEWVRVCLLCPGLGCFIFHQWGLWGLYYYVLPVWLCTQTHTGKHTAWLRSFQHSYIQSRRPSVGLICWSWLQAFFSAWIPASSSPEQETWVYRFSRAVFKNPHQTFMQLQCLRSINQFIFFFKLALALMFLRSLLTVETTNYLNFLFARSYYYRHIFLVRFKILVP